MIQRIEFKLADNAKSVSEHLYNVQLEGNCLIFSEFDEEAFGLAVALEGLDESVYNVIQNRYRFLTLDEPRLTVLQTTQLYDSSRYRFTIELVAAELECLDIPRSFSLTSFNYVLLRNFEETNSLVASLVIDTEFLEFMSVLLFLKEKQGSPLNIQEVPEKVELTVKILRSSQPKLLSLGSLKVFDDNQIKEIEFHFSNVVFERICF